MVQLSNRFVFILLWLTVFTVPWQKGIIIPGVGSINKLLGIILSVVTVLTILLKGEIKKTSLFFCLLFLFVLLNVSSYFWSVSPSDSLGKSILFIQVGFLAWSIYEFANSKQKVNALLKAYVLGCSVISIHSIYLFLTGSFEVTETRFFIEGYNPNQLGILWGFSLPITMYLVINGSKRFMFYFPAAVFSILLTGSRTALVILIFVSLCIIWLLFKYRIKYRKLLTITLGIIGVIIVSEIPTGQIERLSTLGSELTSGTLNGRMLVWDAGIATFTEHPIFGVGSGGFKTSVFENSELGVMLSAHNSYLSVLVENGMVGFVLFMGMLGILYFFATKIDKNNPSRWLSLTLLAIWLILSTASHAEAQKYTWIIFGLIHALYYSYKVESQEKSD